MGIALVSVTKTQKLWISSSIQAVHGRRRSLIINSIWEKEFKRRALLSSFFLAASAVEIPEANDSKLALLQKYLKRSGENKIKNDKERLDSYYKRNYKDYFGFVEGSLKGKEGELSESEKGILEWLQKNN
ncbi:photosystem I reaction center subunit N [Tasmannia lanceolata]|uniref:photosystem I reaction center subunit N n=1 Tax=Tasmannia lanceolata TaxID=3420 RepID=UPI004063904F